MTTTTTEFQTNCTATIPGPAKEYIASVIAMKHRIRLNADYKSAPRIKYFHGFLWIFPTAP